MIRLHLFGAIDLRDHNGEEVRPILAQPKRLALIAYLAAASPRGPHRRDTLHGIFWPDLDQEHARRALNTAVHFLRQFLGEKALACRSADELALDETVVWTDVRAFTEALDDGRLDEGLRLYRGDLLPSFFIADAAGFEEWLERARAHLRRRAAESSGLLSERCEVGQQLAEAITWGRRAAELSDGDEPAVRRLIALLDKVGDRASAIRAYDDFARALATELEAEPSAETVALMERIRSARPARAPYIGGQPFPGSSESSTTEPTLSLADPGIPPRRRRIVPLFGAAIAGLGVLGALAAIRLTRSPTGSGLDANLLAVAPFDVLDPTLAVWREGVVDILSRNLDGAGPLRTVSPTLAVKRWQGRAEAGNAQTLGRQTGAGLVVFGHLMRSGPDSVRVWTAIWDVGAGRTVGEVQLLEREGHMDRLLESLTLGLLQELGRGNWVGGVRPSSISARPLPALKAFLRGEQFYRRMSWDSAMANYDHAITLDSGFALAYYRMAQVVGWESKQSKRYLDGGEYARRAALLNRGQTTRDSLLLTTDPMGLVFVDAEDSSFFSRHRQQWGTLEQAGQLYPGDPEVWYVIAEARFHSPTTHITPTEQLEAFDRAIELDSGFAPAYGHTVQLALMVGDPGRARRYAAAYLSSAPRNRADPSLRLEALLLDRARAGSAETARLIDTVTATQLFIALWDLAQWPDSGETSLRLARALLRQDRSFVGTARHIADSLSRRKILARMLAFRGHLREAYRTAPPYGFQWWVAWWHPFPSMALLGTVPPDSAAVVFDRFLRTDSIWLPGAHPQRALSWWNVARDTASLSSFARRADSAAQRPRSAVARAYFKLLVDAARAYGTLVKGDSAGALRAFSALPDSLCMIYECFYEKLTQARLASALGKDRRAADILDEWVVGELHVNPVGVLGTLERGRIAERLGQRDVAIKSYRFVADVWRHADPELQAYVTEAREMLKRLETKGSY
jgi:serine/threonine-protein kinase